MAVDSGPRGVVAHAGPLPLGALGAVLVAAVGLTVVTACRRSASLSADLPDPDTLGDSPSPSRPSSRPVRDGRARSVRAERRSVVAYEDIPTLVLDATTTAEDRSFWDNPGIDVPNIVSAVAEKAAGEGERGASTITQQLVRARLLPEDVVAPARTATCARSRRSSSRCG